MPFDAQRCVRDHSHIASEPFRHHSVSGGPDKSESALSSRRDIDVESLNRSMAKGASPVACTIMPGGDGTDSEAEKSDTKHPLHPRTWPGPYLSNAKLAEKKGWHLLNECVYGAWGLVLTLREGIHITAWAEGDPRHYAFHSNIPASTEGVLASGLFAVIEALGTAHVALKERRKKSEIGQALLDHAEGHKRFIHGDSAVESLLSERSALTTLLASWPNDARGQPISEWRRSLESPLLNRCLVDADLARINLKMEKAALDLAADFEHYVLYEQAANQFGEANDNIRAVGIAVARDCVVQLGGTACSAADTADRLGASGIDSVATGVASGAFSIAMGALHMAAGMLGWYQAERRLDDLKAVRVRGSDLRDDRKREELVQRAAQHHLDSLTAELEKTESSGVRQIHEERVAAAASQEAANDAASARQLVRILAHHQDKAFDAIEADDIKKIARAKTRMIYGAISIAMGTAFVVLGSLGTGGLLPLIAAAVSLALGTTWLVSGFARCCYDRYKAYCTAKADMRLRAEAQNILRTDQMPSDVDMLANKFVAIDGMLMALLDGDRPITRCALTEALRSVGMDKNLLEALTLRSTVRLDSVYAEDRADILRKLRCFSSRTHADLLKAAIEGMALRSDEVMLKALRRVFQEFIDGKTAMRQQYEARSGALTFLGQKLPFAQRALERLRAVFQPMRSCGEVAGAKAVVPAADPMPGAGT